MTNVRSSLPTDRRRLEGEAERPLELDGRLDLHKGVYRRIVREFNAGRPLPSP